MNKERRRKYENQYGYGLSHEDWVTMWENQDGECAICGRVFESPSDARVDHNHITDVTRGLLCRRCNAALGSLKDSPEILNDAIEYLKEIK